MSEERRVAPRSAALDGAPSAPSFPPVAPATPLAPVTPLAKTADGGAAHPHVREVPAATASPPREGARRRHSVRIPDDEIQRPSTDAAAEKPVLRRPSPMPEKVPDSQLGALTPMRIITINAEPAPVIDRSPPPAASPPPVVAAPTPAIAPPPMGVAPPPTAPSAAAAPPGRTGAAPASSLAVLPELPPDPPTVPSFALAEIETPSVPDVVPIFDSQVPAPRTPAPLDADEVEVRFEDEALGAAAANASNTVGSSSRSAALPDADPAASQATAERASVPDSAPEPDTVPEPVVTFAARESSEPPRDRRSEPPAEIAAEDVFSIESHEPAIAVGPPEPPKLASLPPMRARAPSQPPLPPRKKPAPTATTPAGRPPLVIVPPHVGSIPPQGPDSAGARRKGRFWWEELFNDDFIRTSEKISDAFIKREVRFIEESLGVEKGGALLDLGCGTGRHANELARQGYEVVGFDLSLPMLARAGEEAQENGTKINFMQGDMREMTFEEQFDGVYCWNTSFGYFEEDKNAQVVDRVHQALKGGGLFLLDVINRDFLVRQSPSLAWFEGDGCVCMDEMNIDFITSRMKVKRTMMLDDGRSREIEYTIRIYTLSELGKILHDHGFKVREVSGGLAAPGVFFGNESPRVIVLAEKR
ncbi:MAG TPA: methyltransferase domain-containing protein [Polyangiaceae bacterium]|jgi:SAM-dependent methyltransferase|nr:methyltransferase domain-containing protein [Polyangiaceae bacterium]